ncbi:MAG: hypothetical protein AABY16_01635 [Nanoarchaeota archaeon]
MNLKFVSVALLIFSFVFIVSAVTLTKDATEKVIVTKAYRVSVEDSSDLGSDKTLVFGYADIYAKDYPDQVAARLAIFVYDGIIYRATGAGFSYDQTSGGISREEGAGSIVNSDGTEQNDAFSYFISFDTNSDIDEMEFRFSGDSGRVLKMKEVLKAVEEPIVWRPE